MSAIALADGFYRDLGLRRVSLTVNSMGEPEDGPASWPGSAPTSSTTPTSSAPSPTPAAEQHPLRLLDTKQEAWQDVIERAPQLTEALGADARAHFERVQAGLTALGIAYELDPRAGARLRLLHEHHLRVPRATR